MERHSTADGPAVVQRTGGIPILVSDTAISVELSPEGGSEVFPIGPAIADPMGETLEQISSHLKFNRKCSQISNLIL